MMFSVSPEHIAVLPFYVIRNGGEVNEEYRTKDKWNSSPEHELQQVGRFYSKHLSEGLWQLGEQ